jgi:hypothetical protein
MKDFGFEIRMEMLRLQPNLTVAEVNGMIVDVARCYFDIQKDNASCGVTRKEDFYNFSLLKGVALVTIYREALIEILVFNADDSLIRESEHLAMCDVDDFTHLIRGRFVVPEVGLRISMSEALPWMEKTNADESCD